MSPLSRCRGCDGSGWVEDAPIKPKMQTVEQAVWSGGKVAGFKVVEVEPSIGLRPCKDCSPVAFWLWANGHRGSDHSCVICSHLHRGDDSLLVAAMQGMTEGPNGEVIAQGQAAAGGADRAAGEKF